RPARKAHSRFAAPTEIRDRRTHRAPRRLHVDQSRVGLAGIVERRRDAHAPGVRHAGLRVLHQVAGAELERSGGRDRGKGSAGDLEGVEEDRAHTHSAFPKTWVSVWTPAMTTAARRRHTASAWLKALRSHSG